MSEEWNAYSKDPRMACKYGLKCYQKNPQHHETYKHPPQNVKRKNKHQKPDSKRFKPSPDVDMSPEKNKDQIPEKTDHKIDKNEEQQEKNIVPEENKDNSIKLPENLTYHDKHADQAKFKELFLVEMPPDFFQFYKCLESEQDLEKILASVNLQLIGPFDLLMGKLPVLDDKDLYLIHWRFFYDPPEFQAVLKKKGKSEFHIGYFRDSPDEAPVFVATNDSAKGFSITPVAENIFGAVYLYLQNEKKSSPFISVACQKLMEKVKKWAEQHNFPLTEYNLKKRLAQSVTKTFHGAGIVVPFNKKTELGYRKLVETDVNIKKLFKKLEEAKSEDEKDKVLSEIQPIITYANIAVDECDFGTGLECGINLFCSGLRELQASAVSSLCSVYSLLNRAAFAKIIQAHMKYRRRGSNMSVLSVSEK